MTQAPTANAPGAANARTVLSAATRDCLRLAEGPFDISDRKTFAKLQQDWIAACENALAADGENPRAQIALAGPMVRSAAGTECDTVPSAEPQRRYAAN